MTFADPPATAAWRHRDSREGFEVAYFRRHKDGWWVEGCTTGVEDGRTWVVDYELSVDTAWLTRGASVSSRSVRGVRALHLEGDGRGAWWMDGKRAGELDGCLDVDLESSALTNAVPVRRMPPGEPMSAPAAWVRADCLAVERLEQTYVQVSDRVFDYAAPALGFTARLVYDASGLVLDYPGIAVRVV